MIKRAGSKEPSCAHTPAKTTSILSNVVGLIRCNWKLPGQFGLGQRDLG